MFVKLWQPIIVSSIGLELAGGLALPSRYLDPFFLGGHYGLNLRLPLRMEFAEAPVDLLLKPIIGDVAGADAVWMLGKVLGDPVGIPAPTTVGAENRMKHGTGVITFIRTFTNKSLDF